MTLLGEGFLWHVLVSGRCTRDDVKLRYLLIQLAGLYETR